MRLLRLSTSNFMGLGDFTMAPGGKDADIYGTNAAGKTTVVSALLWLLTDKDARGRKDFAIKPLTDGQPMRQGEHIVEGVFDLENGRTITLKKTYLEKWTKKRGSVEQEFDGHEVRYEVDGVPVLLKHFKDKIAEIADEKLFRILTQPTYVAEQMPWKERRALLFAVCDTNMADSDVIGQDKSLLPLMEIPEIAAGRTLDDHKKAVDARRAAINKELGAIPTRIQENERDLPEDTFNIDVSFENRRATVKKALADAVVDKANLEIGNDNGALAQRLIDANLALSGGRLKWQDAEDKATADLRKRWNENHTAINDKERALKSSQDALAAAERLNATRKERLEAIKIEFEEVQADFVPDAGKTCPTCAQVIPGELQAAAHRTNLNATLDRLEAEAKGIKGDISITEANIGSLKNDQKVLEEAIKDLTAKADNLKIELDTRPTWEGSDEFAALREAQVKAQAAIDAQAGEADPELVASINQKITELDAELAKITEEEGKIAKFREVQTRTDELRGQQKTLAAEFEKLERELYLCDQFTRAKAARIEQVVASKFKLARFKLFNVQINTGIEDCCDVLGPDGVPYSAGLNDAMRANIGIDIINTLHEHYGVKMPILVDNAESIVHLEPTQAQVIRLVVSPADDKLRVEVKK